MTRAKNTIQVGNTKRGFEKKNCEATVEIRFLWRHVTRHTFHFVPLRTKSVHENESRHTHTQPPRMRTIFSC
jgi:hypothetical protein